MERVVKIFRSFAEAEKADREFYKSLTPAERVQILSLLRSQSPYFDDEAKKGLQRVVTIVKRSANSQVVVHI